MNEIFSYVIKVVLASLAVKLLGLNTKKSVISHQKPISWIWKAMALLGKFMFIYGLLVTLSNLLADGLETTNARLGISILTFGFFFWVLGGLTIYFKRN